MMDSVYHVCTNGRGWYRNGLLHKLDGPAYIGFNGIEEWWKNGERHRLDGPATISPAGLQEWWVGGIRHRLDGPARIWPNGHQEWWKNGIDYGFDRDGFWAFWDSLNEFQQENVELLKFFPGVIK